MYAGRSRSVRSDVLFPTCSVARCLQWRPVPQSFCSPLCAVMPCSPVVSLPAVRSDALFPSRSAVRCVQWCPVPQSFCSLLCAVMPCSPVVLLPAVRSDALFPSRSAVRCVQCCPVPQSFCCPLCTVTPCSPVVLLSAVCSDALFPSRSAVRCAQWRPAPQSFCCLLCAMSSPVVLSPAAYPSVTSVAGSVAGGALMSRLRLTPVGAAKLLVGVALTVCVGVAAILLMDCPQVNMAGRWLDSGRSRWAGAGARDCLP